MNYGFNDQKINQWLGRVPVTLSKSFTLDKVDATPYFLRLAQLDTVGEIWLNDETFSSENFHADKILNISSALRKGPNNLTIIISGPVTEAEKRSKQANQPPNCPPDVQNGQCHVNWLRKPAFSFSWDWGPSLPDSGLYQAPEIYSLPKWKILDSTLQLVSKFGDSNQIIRADFYIQLNNIQYPVFDSVSLTLKGPKNIKMQVRKYSFYDMLDGIGVRLFGELSCSTSDVDWWWPNGHGDQPIYDTLAEVTAYGITNTVESYFAFRTVELAQDKMKDGHSFYFKINDKPIFMSGSNFIPLDPVVRKKLNILHFLRILQVVQLFK